MPCDTLCLGLGASLRCIYLNGASLLVLSATCAEKKRSLFELKKLSVLTDVRVGLELWSFSVRMHAAAISTSLRPRESVSGVIVN